ncbi:hypothetical protein A2382_03840 [Candidatus Woesebacteria bacterium RIFOXYB1_FULL_38_16]|uniref:Glycosyltransferase 2-like domain-containing protein n=1 Tax=Candidatus Woesebacteria bacterium RIFOXYB1_FULL_38_16 TaxID=1802538 RepID=A0A1F8CRY6_9BACT|nr:MAG: hypothetical protein A2382_03840 [Candidatus Woesebacteria bacterium RIFOXYB1_FULL_38_16]
MKISIIVTVLNEEESITKLLKSLIGQTKKPDEIVIVDGGSKDGTANIVKSYQKQFWNIRFFIKKGNIACGRNYVIKKARGGIIAQTDGGCVADRYWLERITKPFLNKKVGVVAGYYKMTGKSYFQKALMPFIGVTKNKFNQNIFLPSGRSIAFRKSIWECIGGYDEKLTKAGEDTLFNYALVKSNVKIKRVEEAIVEWEVPSSYFSAMKKFFDYAKGDGESGIWKWDGINSMSHNIRVVLVILRYFAGFMLLMFSYYSWVWSFVLTVFVIIYGFWSVYKIRSSVTDWKIALWAPFIQIGADISVMAGFISGLVSRTRYTLGVGYSKEAVKGLGWMGGLRIVTRGIAFVRVAILARILSPAQFGVFGIATLVLSLLEVFTETGVNIILIQDKKKKIDYYLDTAWIISIFRGFIVSVTLLFSAYYISAFFNSPESRNLIILVAFVPLIRGFINPAVVKFQKNLEFHKEFGFRLTVFAFDSGSAIILALTTHRADSLVWGLIIGAIAEVVLTHLILNPKPKFKFKFNEFKKVMNRGKWVTGAGIFNYLFREGDDMVIGRVLGEYSLGMYQMAYKISTLPISELSDVFGRVTFPVYAKIADDRQRLGRALLKTTVVVSTLVLVSGVVIYLFANEIVLIFLGEKWAEAIPVVRVLTIFGVVRGIVGIAYSPLFALGKQRYVTIITLVGIVGLFASVYPLTIRYGIVGTAWATVIGSIIMLPVSLFYIKRVLNATS